MSLEVPLYRFRIGKVFINITSPDDAKDIIIQSLKRDLINSYICVTNPRTVIIANSDQRYCNVMNNSFLNIPDAEPIIWASRLWGLKNVKRTMGPMLFLDLISNPSNGIRHFLLGDTVETLATLREHLEKKYNSNIVGTFSPPFCEWEDFDYQHISQIINESLADIVWVSMRAPKQDFFAYKITSLLENKLIIGVGAAFRFTLGEYKMAPYLIRKLGLMGLYWGRKNQSYYKFIVGYIRSNFPFLVLLFKILISRVVGKKYYE